MASKDLPFKKRLALIVIPRIFKCYFILLGLTCKQIWEGKEHLEELKNEGQNWIFSLWHQNVSTANYVLKNQGLVVLVSPSFEGELVSTVLELFNNQAERGSSSRGGARALLSMIKRVKGGQLGLITPDGPRGQKFTLEPGAISLSQKTGCPLVPIHFSYSRPKVLGKSWDDHSLPRFFSRIYVQVGKPYFVPAKLKEEEFNSVRSQFEQLMMDNVTACEKRAKGINHEV